jgi:hypothetical protein
MASAINLPYGPGTPLEVSQTFTPLGIRFWDLTQNLPISQGLTVNLRLANSSAPALPAVLTRSGVYAFFGLPGLWAAEHPGPQGYGPPRTFRYIVTVQDQNNNYLPEVLVYTLDETGALIPAGSPPSATPGGARLAHLFSSVSRPVPAGVGAIRADLVDRDTGQPAAWAVIRVQISGSSETWVGIADEAGRVLVLVPYPVMQLLQLTSPPIGGPVGISAQSWTVTVQAQYDPDQLTFPAANFPDAQWPWTDTPSLRDIFVNQPPATIWPSPSAATLELTADLSVGQDLSLTSVSGSPPASDSTLSISRGSSPP